MNIKKNLPLIVALAIPAVLTAVIALSIYLPGVGKAPQHDLVYVVNDYRDYGLDYYDVRDGKIIQNYYESKPISPEYGNNLNYPKSQIYLYDVQTDTSKLMTIEEAAKFKVDPSRTSPDGYRLEYGSSGGVFPFFDGSHENNQYLLGNNRRIKTSITGYDSSFLGWVISE